MIITLPQQTLLAALVRASGAAEKRATSPILGCALITATSDGITVTATDKSITYTGEHSATVEAPGAVAVPLKDLTDVVKLLAGPIRIALQPNGKIKVTAGKSVYNINAFDANDFPPTPAVEDVKTMTIAAGELRRLIDQTLCAVAPEDNRYGLNGIFVEEITTGDAPAVRFVATDGNRLCYSQAAFSGEIGISRKMLLPRHAAQQIRVLLDKYEGSVELSFGARAAVFAIAGVTVHARLLEADFPDYRQVLPSVFKRKATIDRAALDAVIKRVGIFATDGAHTIKFAFTDDALTLTARKLDSGDAADSVEIDFTGGTLTTGFNARLMLEALGTMGGERVIIDMGDELSPCQLRDPDEDRALCIVMPVRIS